MKFTLGWLKQHLDTDATLDRVADTLTAVGLEVEAVSDRAADLAAFRVAYVVEAKQHPNADRLRVCIVDTGDEEVQVVCGAPNARTGMKGVFAPSGTTIPGTGLHLKPTVIRGVESNGMLCSEREMGLSDAHEGIIELPDDAPVGRPFAEVMGLDDPVIEIAITPNRQDCLGVHGVARDLAAAGLGSLKPLDTSPVPGAYPNPIDVRLDFTPDTADACPMFVGRHFRGIGNGPSPKWLQDRLRAIGLRPISALVDITNWMTFDLGRPLHVFDADSITGHLVVRLGHEGDRFMALDDKEYEADETMTVIADDDGMLSLGGVMGGASSGATPETVNCYFEAALFDPVRTAATGRKLGIESDARYRFERGVDPAFVVPGMEIATRLVLELCGGEASELVIAGAEPDWRRTVPFRPARVQHLGGLDIPENESLRILEALGFTVSGQGERLDVSVPSWRCDIGGESDLIEEVCRIHGYDGIPSVALMKEGAVTRRARSRRQQRVATASRVLASRGLNEAVTWSFLPRAHAELFGGGSAELLLANPISADLDAMRPSLLPNLIAAAGRNVDRGIADLGLFEVGPQYAGDRPEDQATVAAGVRRGNSGPRHWAARPRPVDAFDAKADALALLAASGAPIDSLQVVADAPDWYHPGRSGQLKLGPRTVLAAFGEIHPAVLERLDVKGPAVGFEVYLDAVPLPKDKGARTRPPLDAPDLPTVERDFAFIVAADVEAGRVVRAARGADKALIVDVSVFDVYQGKGVEEGCKSVAISVRLQPRDKTLTDTEIEAIAGKVVAAVAKATGGILRG